MNTHEGPRESLYVAVVCDALDALGYRHQAMHRRLRPAWSEPRRSSFAGRARTVQWEPSDLGEPDPYGVEIEAMDSLRRGDVVVHSSTFESDYAPWGELMTTVAIERGAVGCVCDGMIRDASRIAELGFPVHCAGFSPLDSRGRGKVVHYDVPITCGDVDVRVGDLVFADHDGVVVLPQAIEAEALRWALQKVNGENRTREALRQGRTLRDVFDEFGVL